MEIKTAQGILFKHISDKTIDELSVVQLNQIREAMKEYAEQYIDLAAEEAYCTCEIDWVDFHDFSAGINGMKGELQKESILEVKQLIK